MIIKKLNKKEIEEGITLDMVNALPLDKNYSPIQLQKGDELVTTLACTGGFWVSYEPGKFLKDDKGKLMVYTERDCIIGRARYLMNFGEVEKKQKIDALILDWKNEVRQHLDNIKKKVDELTLYATLPDNGMISMLIKADKTEEEIQEFKERHQEKLETLYPIYQQLEEKYNNNEIIELLEYFGIQRFNNPMASVNTDDANGIQALKNTFGGKALAEWDGDILNRYAAIEVEKQYYSTKVLL